MDPDPFLTTLVESPSDVPLLYIGFGSMETYMLDVDWEAVFTVFDSGTVRVPDWIFSGGSIKRRQLSYVASSS